MNAVVLIPAYNPDSKLITLVDDLIRLDFNEIVVVNDGSNINCSSIFNQLSEKKQCSVIHHAVNMGKGRALKTGFNYILLNFQKRSAVITADADGQHQPADISAIAEIVQKNTGKFVIGSRDFTLKNKVPLKSLIGNLLTRFIFAFLIGKKINDTQSGLRGIPLSFLPQILKLSGEGFEYELNVLITTKQFPIQIEEYCIQTVYLDNNKSSHFNPLIDSMKIYFLFIRFSLSSILTSIVDFVFFTLCYAISSKKILLSIIIGRFFAGYFNFTVNKKFVFHNKPSLFKVTLLKYILLTFVLAFLAFFAIDYLANYLGANIIFAKILVESILFVASFSIQREFVFTGGRNTVNEDVIS